MRYFVYILYSKSLDSFYKGQTDDIDDRMKRHNLKQEKATSKGAPWKLVWCIEQPSRSAAVILERKLKNLSRKRLALFMIKYSKGIAGPDDHDILTFASGSS